jgi:DNA-dependent RNA polymerase auxiliary subunit epsilon
MESYARKRGVPFFIVFDKKLVENKATTKTYLNIDQKENLVRELLDTNLYNITKKTDIFTEMNIIYTNDVEAFNRVIPLEKKNICHWKSAIPKQVIVKESNEFNLSVERKDKQNFVSILPQNLSATTIKKIYGTFTNSRS